MPATDNAGVIALTGATGFVGRAVLDRLLAVGFSVRCLTRRDRALPASGAITEIRGDLEDEVALALLVEGASMVIHAAGGLGAEDAGTLRRINVEASRRLARASAAAGASRFIFLSSLAAREPHLSPYAASKREAEAAVAEAAGRMPAVCLRLPAIYGSGDRNTAPLFALMRLGWLPHPAMQSRFSLLHVEDAAGAVAVAAAAPEPLSGMFEIPAGEALDWSILAEAASRARRRAVRPVAVPRAVLGSAAALSHALNRLTGRRNAFTPGKAREMQHADWTVRDLSFTGRTGWRPSVPLAEGLARMLDKPPAPSHSPALGDAYDAR